MAMSLVDMTEKRMDNGGGVMEEDTYLSIYFICHEDILHQDK